MSSNNFFQLVAEFQKNIDWLNQILKGGESDSVNIDGEIKPSISKDLADKWAAISAMVKGRAAYETKSNLPSTPPSGIVLAEVWKDPVFDNNGLYGWTGSAWEKSIYDPVKLSKVLDRQINSGLFFSDTDDDGTTDIITLSDFLIDVEVNVADVDYYWVWRIKRNNGGEWEVNIHAPNVGYGQFLTTTNPEDGDKITTHRLIGNLAGKVSVNWSKIPDGTFIYNASNDTVIRIV